MTAKLHERLLALENNLGTNHYLEGAFTVGDIALTTVLREVAAKGALSDFSSLQAYMDRNEARLFARKGFFAQASQKPPFVERFTETDIGACAANGGNVRQAQLIDAIQCANFSAGV